MSFYAPRDSVLTAELKMEITAVGDKICFLYWMAEGSSVAAALSVGGSFLSLPVSTLFI